MSTANLADKIAFVLNHRQQALQCPSRLLYSIESWITSKDGIEVSLCLFLMNDDRGKKQVCVPVLDEPANLRCLFPHSGSSTQTQYQDHVA